MPAQFAWNRLLHDPFGLVVVETLADLSASYRRSRYFACCFNPVINSAGCES
jgi:hypothetical protein